MLWGQNIKVYRDHKNLTRDALGLTSDRVYCWRLLLEEYAPEIIYIKKIHNTVADAILQLEYDPKLNTTNEYTHAMLGVEPEELSAQRWKSFACHWRSYNEASMPMQAHCFHMNEVFANCSDEDKIYPLTTVEIAAAQWADASLKHLFKRNAVIDIKNWRSNSSRTQLVSANMVSWSSPSHSKCVQLSSITTTYSTLDTHVLKRL